MPAIKYAGNYRQRKRAAWIQSEWGISQEEFVQRVANQNFECEVCYQPIWIEGKNVHIDHNHDTGKLRGILCGNCNKALGLFGDDVKNIESAMLYLDKYARID